MRTEGTKTIKQTYHDVLFWASSKLTDGETFHLNPSEFKVMMKLIQYDKKNSKITYSNELIAQHTFLKVRTVEDAMYKLKKAKYIKSAVTTVEKKSRRTSYIQWDFIEELFEMLPVYDRIKEDTEEQTNPTDITTPDVKDNALEELKTSEDEKQIEKETTQDYQEQETQHPTEEEEQLKPHTITVSTGETFKIPEQYREIFEELMLDEYTMGILRSSPSESSLNYKLLIKNSNRITV